MSEQAGYSPSFKRPAEIMRMRRKRARSGRGDGESPGGQGATGSPGQGASSPVGVRPFIPGPRFNPQGRSGSGLKRRNPFASLENTYNRKKKFLIHDEDGHEVNAKKEEEEEDGRTRGGFGSGRTEAETAEWPTAETAEWPTADSTTRVSVCEDESVLEDDECGTSGTSPLLKSPSSVPPVSMATPACMDYPADWSLKTRLLFTSPLSLAWAEQLKAQEEATGLSQHCRAHFTTLPPSLQDPRACPELRCAFHQSLVYWQQPSLPWLSLFPRIDADRNFSGKSAPWAQDTALQHSLHSEWSISLSSLYSLLKNRLCPYFYVCSHQFTVLFRAAGLSAANITALISPTTRGLREALKAEGIEFSLPLVEERRKSRGAGPEHQDKDDESPSGRSETSDGEAGDGDDEDEDEDGGFSWLKEMGVQDKIKTPDSIALQLRRERVSVDHRPESAALVGGAHTFTLINFLMNWKGAVAWAGPQAGLPPTLLAPVAFRGAAMHTLKARSVNVQTPVGNTFRNISSLEVTGPVLPSALHTITTILRSAQRGTFTATVYTHTPTSVMNTHTTQQVPDGLAELRGCGLHPASIRQLQSPSPLGKTALTHISMNDYRYTWKN